ncbi:magnesium transporter [Vulgatibacter incomptus]|uniref:magnesium transporter n=1 Tax=Vulgatibacter incomptus TaxID=1391653 RepID=UPI000681D609|nr:magnesium transporter [Vulgatibacter incomptus]
MRPVPSTLPDSESIRADDLRAVWPILSAEDRAEGFLLLPRDDAEEFFLELDSHDHAALLMAVPPNARRLWLRYLAPDDAADAIQQLEPEERGELLCLLDDLARNEVSGLLAYADDAAGGLMSPRFARVRPDATVDEAIAYLRRQARNQQIETVYYAYVLDGMQRLLGVVSFRELFVASPEKHVSEVMKTEFISLPEDMDQEAVARIFAQRDLMALPVLDAEGRMKGIVTADDIVDVVEEEATEDIQKLGGMEALDMPYLRTPFGEMVRKRAGWLAALFLGEMLTATAMGHFEDEIAKAVVLALFVPLIISSGGNSGSQATTLVIRAMALGELRIRDWWRVIRRELASGLSLGVILASIGFARIVIWEHAFHSYGEHYLLVAGTVALSLIGVVTWGTLAGSMLPFLLKRIGFDPASASAPFVATLVDVSGLVIYFTVAQVILSGTML